MRLRFEVTAPAAGAPAAAAVRLVVHAEGAATPRSASGPFELAIGQRLADVLQRVEANVASRDDLLEAGTELWNALNPPDVRALADPSLGAARPGGPAVHVQLAVPEGGDLGALPWEAIHDVRTETLFASDPRYAVTRAAPDAAVIAPAAPAQGPLRVLVVTPSGSWVQAGQEWNELVRAARAAPGALELQRLDGRVTPARLLDELHAAPGYHVLHFIGHGDSDAAHGPHLVVNGEDGPDAALDATALANMLVGTEVRLVVLNSCLGATPAVSRLLTAMGPHLMRTAGIPYVVAMRYEVLDASSIRFATTFYRHLATSARPGDVRAAVQAARMALLVSATADDIRGVVTPVLYASADSAPLLEARSPVAAPRALVTASPAPAVELPPKLLEAFKAHHCIPVVGGALEPAAQVRRAGAATPGTASVVWDLADACAYPERDELEALVGRGDWLADQVLARVCQCFQDRADLLARLQALYEKAKPSPLLKRIARWPVPGLLYTAFDGLLEAALSEEGQPARVMNHACGDRPALAPSGGAASAKLLANLRGSLRDLGSLVLTEADLEDLLERFPVPGAPEVVELAGRPFHSLLFLGISPRHPLARRAARLVDTSSRSAQGPCFFVWKDVSAADEAFWRPFRVQWIREDAAAVIAALEDAIP